MPPPLSRARNASAEARAWSAFTVPGLPRATRHGLPSRRLWNTQDRAVRLDPQHETLQRGIVNRVPAFAGSGRVRDSISQADALSHGPPPRRRAPRPVSLRPGLPLRTRNLRRDAHHRKWSRCRHGRAALRRAGMRGRDDAGVVLEDILHLDSDKSVPGMLSQHGRATLFTDDIWNVRDICTTSGSNGRVSVRVGCRSTEHHLVCSVPLP